MDKLNNLKKKKDQFPFFFVVLNINLDKENIAALSEEDLTQITMVRIRKNAFNELQIIQTGHKKIRDIYFRI